MLWSIAALFYGNVALFYNFAGFPLGNAAFPYSAVVFPLGVAAFPSIKIILIEVPAGASGGYLAGFQPNSDTFPGTNM
jgi:hypothetical protein